MLKSKAVWKMAKRVGRTVMKWVFPPRCPICDEVLLYHENRICSECVTKIKYIKEPRCTICGKELRDEMELLCYDCSRRKHFYTKGCALWEYEGVADSIFLFKNQGRLQYADFYGEELCKHLGEEILSFKADALIPVPLHKSKMRKRGYNQAEVIANQIGERLGIPVKNNLVKRVRKTDAQKHLRGSERENNVKKAFHICQNDVKLESIIIIDDVYTTGSTIDAVAREFRSIGVDRIYYVTLAIGRGQ